MIRIEKLHSNTDGNSHTVRSEHLIIEIFFIIIAIESSLPFVSFLNEEINI
jgi:hypothetical protein